MALIDKLTSIANSIRAKTGTTEKLTLDQMVENVNGIDVMPETVILVDEDGVEIPAVFTDEVVNITATPNDIRKGCVAVNGDGIVIGEKEIPSYHTTEGVVAVPAGGSYIIYSQDYDYTKLQGIICAFNTSLANSTGAEKVAINEGVYNVFSPDLISTAIKDSETNSINFGIVNDSEKTCVLRFFMYKEEY